jgi:hypothetical protein
MEEWTTRREDDEDARTLPLPLPLSTSETVERGVGRRWCEGRRRCLRRGRRRAERNA